jgi:hypothetical protein
MHDLATRLMNEIASARAAIAASYVRLWHGQDRDSPSAACGSPHDYGEPAGDTRAEPDQKRSP